MQNWMNIMNILDTYLMSNKSQENHNNDSNSNNNNNNNSNKRKQPQEYFINNNILNEKRSIQQGINLLQLAMNETDESTCLTLYELAMEKLNSINHPAIYNNTSNSNSNNAYQHDNIDSCDQQHQYTRSIWTQGLIIMTELVNLFIIILQHIPIPDLFIRMTSFIYSYIIFIEKRHHILQYTCTQIIYGLYFIINKCQQYELPRYISYLIYIFVVFSIKLMKILIEYIHLENQNQHHHQHYHTI
ncbi:hypothetical protein BJ944DRAFT_269312, partial [Cunninghamella echinulata]